MPPEHQNSPNTNPLGTFISLLGVLGILLYFTGWTYRWAYFSFYELDINTLNLSLESFFLVSIQVLIGNIGNFTLSIITAIITMIVIKITLWLISDTKVLSQPLKSQSIILSKPFKSQSIVNKYKLKIHGFWLFKKIRSFTQGNLHPLISEAIIVAWILTALFCLGTWQGSADAFLDAVNETSTKPIITLATKSDNLALGRDLDDLFTNPSLKGFRIVGDVEQFKKVRGQETNDTTNPKQPTVWRLLIQNNGWIYIFPALASGAKGDQRPLLLAINAEQGQVQLVILSRPKRHR